MPDLSPASQHDGKEPYETREDARAAANIRRAQIGGRFSTYRCLWCQNWHFGHESPGKAKRRDRTKTRQRYGSDAYAR